MASFHFFVFLAAADLQKESDLRTEAKPRLHAEPHAHHQPHPQQAHHHLPSKPDGNLHAKPVAKPPSGESLWPVHGPGYKPRAKVHVGQAHLDQHHEAPCPQWAKIKKFIINLDRRKDRLSQMAEALYDEPDACSKTCRVAAVDGSQLDNPGNPVIQKKVWKHALEREKSGEKVMGGRQTRGGIALILSHALIWQQIVAEDLDWAVVFEDDAVHYRDNFRDSMCKLAKGDYGFDWSWVKLNQLEEDGNLATTGLNRSTNFGTAMYAITKQAALELLKTQFPMKDNQLDAVHGAMRQLPNSMTMIPGVVWATRSRDGDTDVQIIVDENGKPVKKKVVDAAATGHKLCPVKDCELVSSTVDTLERELLMDKKVEAVGDVLVGEISPPAPHMEQSHGVPWPGEKARTIHESYGGHTIHESYRQSGPAGHRQQSDNGRAAVAIGSGGDLTAAELYGPGGDS